MKGLAWMGRVRVPEMTRGAAYSVVVLFVLTLAVGGLNLMFTARQVNASQQKWCSTLDLLTSRPVPRPRDPAANPSREQSYVLYSDFVALRQRLGCG